MKKLKEQTNRFKELSFKKKATIVGGCIIVLALVAVMMLFLSHLSYIRIRRKSYDLITYQDYLELLDQRKVQSVTYREDDKYMYISLRNDMTANMSVTQLEQYRPSPEECRRVYYPGGEDFAKELLEQGVLVVKEKPVISDPSLWGELLVAVIPIALLLAFMKKVTPSGKTAVMEVRPEDLEIGFDDIIGHEEVKKDLMLLVRQMKSKDEKVKALTHGILFEGSPGTGKTMLAKAVAKEAGYSFVSVDASGLIELYVGVGAKRVRGVFEKAYQKAPCIVFIDEIDAIGTRRGSRRSNSENDQTINALLAEMDGFGRRGGIVVIAATNRAEDLDPALVRAGRFDRTIRIDVPYKWETRKELFDHYLSDSRLDENVDTESLAKQTVGYSGADIAAICREASMIMLSKDKDALSQAELEEAIDKIRFKGNRSSDERSDTLEVVAYHEAGHAVMTLLCHKPVARISVMGMTSGVGGAVFQADEGKIFHTKSDLEQQIRILYAGRASEEIRFGKENVTDGASNDISEATRILADYVMKYGFDKELIDYSVLGEELTDDSDVRKRIIDISIRYYEETRKLLEQYYDSVEILAKKLLEVKTISGTEMEEMDLL